MKESKFTPNEKDLKKEQEQLEDIAKKSVIDTPEMQVDTSNAEKGNIAEVDTTTHKEIGQETEQIQTK